MGALQEAHRRATDRDGYGWGVDAEELRRYFLEYEATIGFTSTFGAALAADAGVEIGAGPPANWDPYARIVHKLTEAKAVYRALKRMLEAGRVQDVVVLWRLYGPRNGRPARTAAFGRDALAEHAALLAPLTEAAKSARDEFVLRESTTRSDLVERVVAQRYRETIADFEMLFWREAKRVAKLEEELSSLRDRDAWAAKRSQAAGNLEATQDELRAAKTKTARARLESRLRRLERELRDIDSVPDREQAVARRIQASRMLMGQIVGAVSCDGTIRAKIGAIESTDREITIEDAIREKLDAPRPRGKDAQQAWKATRDSFVTAVRIEANKMRREAHQAYRAAKQVSS